MSFDSDTALDSVHDGLWRGFVPSSWFVTSGPNGGFVAALAVRAIGFLTERPPRSLTLHYVVAPVEGDIEVACEVVREGRSTTALRLEFTQGQRTVALGLAACADPRDDQPEWFDAVPPAILPPADCEYLDPDRSGVPPFFRNYEVRWQPSDPAVLPASVRAWMRTSDPRPLDHIALGALTDAMFPAAFLRMPERLFVPTIDLTIHWRAPLPDGEHAWVLGVFTTRVGAGGVCEEDGELWSEDGLLLAQSRQLAIVRRPRSRRRAEAA